MSLKTKMGIVVVSMSVPCMGGCTSPGPLNDLSLSSVHAGPSSSQLEVEFSTRANLSQLIHQHRYVLASEGYFCDRPHEYVIIMGRTLYYEGRQISGDVPITNARGGGKFLYSTYINTFRMPIVSAPREEAFDLRQTAQDVCFFIAGGNGTPFGLKSNIITVPKEAIIEALRRNAAFR